MKFRKALKMKLTTTLVLILFSTLIFGQIKNPQAKELFIKGLNNYDFQRYEIADSLFSQSIAIEPSLDAIYYRALSKKDIDKTCKRCEKYKKDMEFSSKLSSKYYEECEKKDSIAYEGSSPTGFIYYCLVYTEFIESKEDMDYYFYRTNTLNGKTISFSIEKDINDTTVNPIAVFPDLGKLPVSKIEYALVDEMPNYIGGDEARINFIVQHMRFPSDARENRINGTVYVTFVIDETGMVKEVKLLRGFYQSCDDEALRVVRIMPKWIPGMVDGKPVRVRFNMPIRFTTS
jgi:TonB family protein